MCSPQGCVAAVRGLAGRELPAGADAQRGALRLRPQRDRRTAGGVRRVHVQPRLPDAVREHPVVHGLTFAIWGPWKSPAPEAAADPEARRPRAAPARGLRRDADDPRDGRGGLRGRRAAPPARAPARGSRTATSTSPTSTRRASGGSSPTRELRRAARSVLGQLHEPQGVGMPLAISPAYALGGRAARVELAIAALTALAFVLAAALARRRGARAVGERRRAAGRPVAAGAGGGHHGLARAGRRGAAGGRRAVRAEGARARAAALRVRRARCCWRRCRGWTRALAIAGLPSRSASCAGRWPRGGGSWALIARESCARLGRLLRALQRDVYGGPLPSAAAPAASPGRGGDLRGPAGQPARACGWTRRPGCCAGRRCSRSPSSARGCWRARGASAWPPRSRSAARPSGSPSCCWPSRAAVAGRPPSRVESADGPWLPGAADVRGGAGAGRARRVGPAPRPRRRRRARRVTLALSAWVLGDAWTGPAEGWLSAAR